MFLHNYGKLSAQLSAQLSAHENFFQKKYTHAGSLVNTTLPACCIYYFTLQNLQSSAQNYQNAEDTALLYYIEAHKKIAAEVAASAQFFSIRIYRTLEAVHSQSAATLSTITATFCSIIIEAGKQQIELCPTATHDRGSGNRVVSEDTANLLHTYLSKKIVIFDSNVAQFGNFMYLCKQNSISI